MCLVRDTHNFLLPEMATEHAMVTANQHCSCEGCLRNYRAGAAQHSVPKWAAVHNSLDATWASFLRWYTRWTLLNLVFLPVDVVEVHFAADIEIHRDVGSRWSL